MLDAAIGSTITFSSTVFPPGAPITIALASALPSIQANSVTIDASNSGVILDGSGLAAGDGIVIDGADGVTISGLEIINFSVFDGIVLRNGATNAVIGGDQPGKGNVLRGNSAGVWLRDSQTMSNTITGNSILDNTFGVLIEISAKNNTVGGAAAGARNIISNNLFGVLIQDAGTSGNQIAGNYIGTNAAGSAALGNTEGVAIEGGATGNIIGGSNSGEGNLISGNTRIGVTLADEGTSANKVLGNYIGPNTTGSSSIGNSVGIAVLPGATANSIGDSAPGSRNIISGNTETGIHVEGPGTTSNQIMGNYIGTDSTGANSLANPVGIFVGFTAKNNVIGGTSAGQGNVVSGNATSGIQFQSNGTTGNKIQGNYIGTNASGASALGNQIGITLGYLFDGVQSNEIGGAAEGAGNVISGNSEAGIVLMDTTTTGNKIVGNYVGLDASGSKALSNNSGVVLMFGANNNQVGGLVDGAGNVISGNTGGGIAIGQLGAGSNLVQGNYIGTDLAGNTSLGNAVGISLELGSSNNVIGGTDVKARNLISGNTFGIQLAGSDITGNQVQGNYVGTNITGTVSLGNGTGIVIASGANGNTFAGNLISGNVAAGIQIQEAGSANNRVWGNYMGTNATGTGPLGNRFGVAIGFGAQNNDVGGNTTEKRNVISGNTEAGVVIQGLSTNANDVQGNYIGTNAAGNAAVANNVGVIILDGAKSNRIGGTSSSTGNVISGNTEAGLALTGSGTNNNSALNNLIGSDAAGDAAVPNETGVRIYLSASNNTIGSAGTGNGNMISGNTGAGLLMEDTGTVGNQVIGNLVGAAGSGDSALGNGSDGISLEDGATGNTIGISNTIAFNGAAGVANSDASTLGNTITRNAIHHNSDDPISFVNTPDPVPEPTLIYSEEDSTLSGTTCPDCRLELFANPSEILAGTLFLKGVTADDQGKISTELTVPEDMPYLTVTVTDTGGTTSEFSAVESRSTFYNYLPTVLK
jgi:titin